MHTLNRITIDAPPETVFAAAADTPSWPDRLPHYRYVHTLYRADDVRVVEMSADRDFGWFRYPTWWSSIQWNEPEARRVRFKHVGGITRGMDVVWQISPRPAGGVEVTIVHDLAKRNPLVASFYAVVVGRIFVHFIAQRTLEGMKLRCEQGEI